MYKITITPLADQDLEEIWLYTYEKWTFEQANKYLREVTAEINKIAVDVEIGKKIENVKKGYWRYRVNQHYIIYRVFKTRIDVVRILHEKMDTPRHI